MSDEQALILRSRLDVMVDRSSLGAELDCMRDRARRDDLRMLAYEAAQLAIDNIATRLEAEAEILEGNTSHGTQGTVLATYVRALIQVTGGRPGR